MAVNVNTIPANSFPLRHAGEGRPLKSSAGNYYALLRTATAGQLALYKATDPIAGTWTAGAAHSHSGSAVEAVSVYNPLMARAMGDKWEIESLAAVIFWALAPLSRVLSHSET